jgi:hypothetical protein
MDGCGERNKQDHVYVFCRPHHLAMNVRATFSEAWNPLMRIQKPVTTLLTVRCVRSRQRLLAGKKDDLLSEGKAES